MAASMLPGCSSTTIPTALAEPLLAPSLQEMEYHLRARENLDEDSLPRPVDARLAVDHHILGPDLHRRCRLGHSKGPGNLGQSLGLGARRFPIVVWHLRDP